MDIARMLRNGTQAPVKLIITKFRTKEQLAGFLGRKMEIDSARCSFILYRFITVVRVRLQYRNGHDYIPTPIPTSGTLRFIPFSINSIQNIKGFGQMNGANQARKLGLTPTQAYTLASIVEEETAIT